MLSKKIIGTLLLAGSLAFIATHEGLKTERNKPKQEQTQKTFQLSEDYILREGIEIKSELWSKIKRGELSGAGRTSAEWAAYLSQVEAHRAKLFNRLKPSVKEELDKYRFSIQALGGGGSWSLYMQEGVKEWDDLSDFHLIKFEGVHLAYSADDIPDEDTIVHEYLHGIWDIYGSFADKASRKINREQFKTDTERFVYDKDYECTSAQKDIIESWCDKSADGRMRITQNALTERFAHLAELYYKNPEELPSYIKRHYEPFFK